MKPDHDAEFPAFDFDQLDPEHDAFWRIRGFATRPEDWQVRLAREREEADARAREEEELRQQEEEQRATEEETREDRQTERQRKREEKRRKLRDKVLKILD